MSTIKKFMEIRQAYSLSKAIEEGKVGKWIATQLILKTLILIVVITFKTFIFPGRIIWVLTGRRRLSTVARFFYFLLFTVITYAILIDLIIEFFRK